MRKGLPLGVLMIDIDHFKQVNDVYGHVVGDRVLRDITALIRHGMREGDILLRYGGEEFLLILPGASREDVYLVAERVRYLVRDHKTQYGENQIGVTVSAGGDSMPETSVASEQEFDRMRGQRALSCKKRGRIRSRSIDRNCPPIDKPAKP